VNPITNAPFTDSSGAPCVASNVIRSTCISQVAVGLLNEHVPQSATGTVVTLSPAPRDHAVYMARGDYHPTGNNQLNAHFFADRSDSSSWPGNVNYVQQAVFSDVNQFGVSDSHIFGPKLLNEFTFSYLTSTSGGGAVTQLAPRDQGVNVNVGNDGRGMSYSVSGSVNLSYPGVNAQDYYSWQLKDTMTFNTGNHTLKWGYGQCDRGLHDRRVRTGDDGVRHRRSQPVYGEASALHRGLVQGSSEADAELRPALRAVHSLRSERRPPYDLGR
jgi:hypothetical protein